MRPSNFTRRRVTIAACAASLLTVAGACGDDNSTTNTGSSPAASSPTESSATGASPSESSATGASAPESSAATDVTPVIDPGDGGNYSPTTDPANFVDVIDNPYMPLIVGSTWVYEGESEGEMERTEVVVTDEQKTVMGVSVVVVRDTVYTDGELTEDTYDWFAQDADGNVWYFGEEVKNYDGGTLSDTTGSWEAGVDGALPGIVMPAEPTVGHAYRQEYYKGEAEDLAEIIEVGTSATVAAGSFDDVVTTRDWNPFEPDVIEEKQYAPGVGLIGEVHVAGGEGQTELVEFTPGGEG